MPREIYKHTWNEPKENPDLEQQFVGHTVFFHLLNHRANRAVLACSISLCSAVVLLVRSCNTRRMDKGVTLHILRPSPLGTLNRKKKNKYIHLTPIFTHISVDLKVMQSIWKKTDIYSTCVKVRHRKSEYLHGTLRLAKPLI